MIHHLHFDLPVSVNKMYRRKGQAVFLTNEAQAWKTYAIVVARRQWPYHHTLKGNLAVTYRFYGTRLDFDNGLKLLNDALNTEIWEDDRQILQAHIFITRKDSQPRVEIDIEELS